MWSLVALGIGAIIGAGLFVRTAAAASDCAGSGVTMSFVVAGKCLYLCLYHFGRIGGLDHWLGPDYGICPWRSHGIYCLE